MMANHGRYQLGGLWMMVQVRPFNGDFHFIKRNKICGGAREKQFNFGRIWDRKKVE